MPQEKTILCFSGGLDSTVLLYKLLNESRPVECLNFSYGARHNLAERKRARGICEEKHVRFTEVELPFVEKLFSSSLLQPIEDLPRGTYTQENIQSTVVPGRNTIFMAIAAGYAESAGANTIAIANHHDDHATYPDTRPEWIESIKKVVELSSEDKVTIRAPFTNRTKQEICTLGHELDVPFQLTWTCYEGGQTHCGVCTACFSRKKAFAQAKIADPTSYLR